MKLFTDLQHRFGWTRNEIRVLVLLTLTLPAGAVIRWLRSGDGAPGGITPAFTYAQADSEFFARSRASLPDSTRRSSRKTPPREPIDINRAGKEQLLLLPGVGNATADLIVRYRSQHGPFRTVEDLLRVKGIGPKKLEKLRPYVTVVR
ncbi:MAG: helix-hairpin-helix domain-containing protein [Bacteroidota bacterium]